MNDVSQLDWRLQLLGALLTLLTGVATAAIPLLVRAATRFLDRRLALELTEAEQTHLASAVARGIGFADEQARKALTALANGERPRSMRSSDKLATATSFAVDELDRLGVSRPSHDTIRQLIEARLGTDRSWDSPALPTTVVNVTGAVSQDGAARAINEIARFAETIKDRRDDSLNPTPSLERVEGDVEG